MNKVLPTANSTAIKLIFLSACIFFSFSKVFADVIVTPANTGLNISADKAANALVPAYTSIGNIVITETLPVDFLPGNGQTLILTAPAGWQFNTSAGSVSSTFTNDISNVLITVSATDITITYDIGGITGLDELTISGIEMQAVNGGVLPSAGQLYRSLSNPGTAIVATVIPTLNTDGSGGTNFGSLSQVAGNAAKLAFTTEPAGAVAGTVFAQQPVVITQDQFGTVTATGLAATENITLTLSTGTGILSGTNVLNIGTGGGNGTVNFTNLQVDLAGVKRITATGATLTAAETNDFTVSAANSSTILSSDINPSCINGTVILTATITGITVTGTVEFFDGITSLGTAPVISGTAALSTAALPAGARSLTAVYSGDVNNNTSTSAAYVQNVNQQSADPTSATASVLTICNGQSSTLTLNGGGGGTGETINWYTGSCGGTLAGTGNNLSVSPVITTTYYGRYEDGSPCNYNSACAQVTITVNQPSANPVSATASVTTICNGQSSILTLNGGGGGTGETINWYSNSCGDVFVGTGFNLSVSPAATTTYYGRYENAAPCNVTSACAQVTITVNQPSANPVSATASVNTICNGQSTTLTLNGGGGGTAETIRWYSSSCGTGLVGSGNNLSVSPTATTTYYGRYENAAPCNTNSACAQVTITVNQQSLNPTSATASATTICNGQSTTLTLNGGGTGTGEVIRWYSSACGTGLIGTGNNLSLSPLVTTTYYGRYEDAAPCNYNSACSQVTITVNQKSANPTSATASVTTICNGQSSTLTLNGGGGGTGEVIRWYSSSCGVGLAGTGNGLVVSPTVTTTYYGRYEDAAPCNYNSTCVQVTITVNQKSANPTSATASATTICNGQSSTLTLNGGGGGTGPVIKWYSGSCGGTAAGTGNGLVVSPATTTTYFGRYENAAPCSFNTSCASVTITVNQRPTANITSPNTAICKGSSTNITGTVTATGNWNLTLSNGSTASGTGNGSFSITVSPSVTTTYTIAGLTDAVCVSIAADRTGSTAVTVRAPVANAGVNQTICAGGSTVIGAATPASGSTAPYTYAWSPATGLSSATAANPTATPPSTPFTYTLIVTDVFGCSSPGSSMTISSGSPVKNWVGSGSLLGTGPDNNFNNAQNWSPGGVPGSCNDVVISLIGSANINLSANATINSLNFNGLAGTDVLNAQASTLTINNTASIVSNLALMQIGVSDASAAGVIDFKGNVSIGTGAGLSTFIGNTNSRLIFRKNLNMESMANVATGSGAPGSAEFLGSGAQVITWNTNAGNLLVGTSRFRNVVVGDVSNNPTVTIAGSQKVDNMLGNLTVNGSSVLDLGTNQWNRNSAGGTFQLNGTATLRLAAASSVQTGFIFVSQAGIVVPGSNYPGGFTSVLSSTSTVEYYGSVAQTIFSTPTYGNITLTNNSIKTAGGPLTAAGNLLINSTATFKANGTTGWTHNIGGNWTNNGSFTYVAGTTNIINFNGNNPATISGSSVTNFHSVTVNKGTSIATLLNLVSTATTAASPATMNFNNGLFVVQSTGIFTHNGAGPTIAASAGLQVNGGTFNLTDGSVTNNGLIRISSGIANFGTVAGNSVNTATGGTFDMQSGTVGIAARLVNTAGTLNISGGTITLSKVGNASITGTFDMSLTTNMNVSGGTVFFQNANTAGNDIQIVNSTGTKTFSGGLFQIGNALTPAANIFRINSAVSLYNLTVNNTNAPTARLITSPLSLKNNLTIAGGTLDAATANLNITLGGNWVNNGSFLQGTATVTMNGTAAEAISGTSNTLFYNLINSNTTALVSVSNDISVAKQLLLNTGATLNLAANITLKSDATSTANLGQVNTNNAISYGTGRFIVERYIPNHPKAWQFLAVPATGQTVNQAWQEGNTPLANAKPGYGTIITSDVAGAVAQGFDIYTPIGPTMKSYNSGTGGWNGVTSTSNPIANQKGYMLFVRGDRSVTAFNQPATATTLRTTGKLYTPGTDAPATIPVAPGSFESIGNPYASAIDFSAVTKTGGVQTGIFYLWDPKLTTGPNTAFGLGGYQTFSWNGSSYDVTPGGGSYAGTNRNIESGQAFFVSAPLSAGTVSFTEAAKVTGSNNVNRPTTNMNQLRTNLKAIVGNESILIDGNLLEFGSAYSNETDIDDAAKLNNTGENLGIQKNNKVLAVERRAIIISNDTIFYKLGQPKVQQYELEFIPAGMNTNGLTAFLEDNYLNSKTPVSLTDTNRVSFRIENIPGSYAADRFRLVFKQLNIVPVKFKYVNAKRNTDKSIAVEWGIENETRLRKYTVERSSNGEIFTGILTADPLVNNGGSAVYNLNDLSPLLSDNFYRIKALDMDGRFQYSSIVRVNPLNDGTDIVVYPNPVTGNSFQLQFTGQPFGKYELVLINNTGTKYQLAGFEINAFIQSKSVALPQVLGAGIYRLQVSGPEGKIVVKTVNILK